MNCQHKAAHICTACNQRLDYLSFTEQLRTLTAKPSRNATQRERDIYRYACGLMVALEGGVEV